MKDAATLLALAERCENAAADYDPQLCSDVHDALPEPKCVQPPNYCRSVDAATVLVPEDAFWDAGVYDWGGGVASVNVRRADGTLISGACPAVEAATPALALTAAALRAHAAIAGGEKEIPQEETRAG